MPLFRTKRHFRVPTLKPGPIVAAAMVCLLVVALVVLSMIDPRPALRHFEVPVANERFAH